MKTAIILTIIASVAISACRREVPHVPYKTYDDTEEYYKR